VTAGAAPDLAAVAARLGRHLAAAGVVTTTEAQTRFARAVATAAPCTRHELYWLGRVTLLSGPEQVARWDEVFDGVFGGGGGVAPGRRSRPRSPAPRPADVAARRDQRPPPAPMHGGGGVPLPAASGGGSGDGDARDGVVLAASVDERLRHRDFASLEGAELELVRQASARLARALPPRRSRRQRPHRRGGVDLRATLGGARRTGGEPLHWERRRHQRRPRRLVLLCDISGSMEAYSRAYLQLLAGAVSGGRAEAFAFATRLTRITGALRHADADSALARAGRAAPDWSGGTRIGEAVKAFLDGFGRRGMARGAVIVVISDGWERASPDVLAEQMARLRRLAHRVVWVNPRKADPRFQPLAAGMAAALPHVDALVSGHSLHALDEVAAALGGVGAGRS